MPGYVSASPEQEGLVKLTGGILYDRNVGLAFRRSGWRVDFFDLETLPRHAKMLKYPACRLILNRTCRDFDVLVSDLGNSALTLRLQRAAGRSGALTVLICHHFRAHLERSLPRRLLYGFTEKRITSEADILVANSPHTARKLVEMGRIPADIVLAPPGLSIHRAEKPRFRDNPSSILMVGSIEPRKGVVESVRALAASGLEHAVLTIAGEPGPPEYLLELRGCIESLGLDNRVRLVGRLGDEGLRRAYSEADAFMLLSRWEGYGMAIAEAMASGLPVISTTAGAIPDLVDDGISGLLVNTGDWATAGERLRSLFSDRSLRMNIAQGALDRAAGFPTWEESTGRIFDAVAGRLRRRT